MSIDNQFERLAMGSTEAADLPPVFEVTDGRFWNPTDHDLRKMYENNLHRYGLLVGIFDLDGNMLMLEHAGSDKTQDGMWGPLGETSKVQRAPTGEWRVEPTVATLMRGIQEELGVQLSPQDIFVTANEPAMMTTWPVGVRYGRQHGAAYSPVIYISETAKQLILSSATSEEVRSKRLMDPGEVLALTHVRPGTHRWLSEIVEFRDSQSSAPLVHPQSAVWDYSPQHPLLDAILAQMYEGDVA